MLFARQHKLYNKDVIVAIYVLLAIYSYLYSHFLCSLLFFIILFGFYFLKDYVCHFSQWCCCCYCYYYATAIKHSSYIHIHTHTSSHINSYTHVSYYHTPQFDLYFHIYLFIKHNKNNKKKYEKKKKWNKNIWWMNEHAAPSYSRKRNPLHIHFYTFMMVKNMFLYITFDDYNFKTEIYFMRFVRQQFFTIFLFFYIFTQ